MLDDIQNTTQYIANAIDLLNQVTCRPFPVMGWSQGGLASTSALPLLRANPAHTACPIAQFTFAFYPSTRRKVSHFFGLAADFRGMTTIGTLSSCHLWQNNELTHTVADLPGLVSANATIAPSIWQQSNSSELISVLGKKGGNYNWVPTTSLFSRSDEVVLPQDNATMEGSTSFIGGTRAGNILVQDFCPNVTVAHGEWLWANFGFQIVKLALDSQMRFASPATVRTAVAKGDIVCKQDDVA